VICWRGVPSTTTSALGTPARRGWFWAAFALSAVAAVVPLWCVKYVPMVDLPLHGLQISIWKNLNDPRYGFAEFYDLHYFTPYFGIYGLARIFASWLSVLVAMKLAITISVLALPLSLVAFFARTGAPRWWSLLGFPLAFGYSFDWGFVNFITGVPAAFVYFALVVDYAREPTGLRAAAVATFTLLLFWTHGLLVIFCPLLAGVIVLDDARGAGARRIVARLAPLATPLPLMIAWYFVDSHRAGQASAWQLGPDRFFDLFTLTDLGPSGADAASMVVTGLVILLRDRDPARAKVTGRAYALTLVVMLFGPDVLVGVGRITPRFGVFLLPLLVAWLCPAAPRAVRVALFAAVFAWSALLVTRFQRFDRDARDYDDVAASVGPRSRIRPLIFIETVADVPFLHMPAWTAAAQGGLYGLSFSAAYPVARNLPGSPEVMSAKQGWESDRFDWRRELDSHYDTYVVRSSLGGPALTRRLFDGAGDAIKLVAERGRWHVYVQTDAHPP
jgi:hypothetical protein